MGGVLSTILLDAEAVRTPMPAISACNLLDTSSSYSQMPTEATGLVASRGIGEGADVENTALLHPAGKVPSGLTGSQRNGAVMDNATTAGPCARAPAPCKPTASSALMEAAGDTDDSTAFFDATDGNFNTTAANKGFSAMSSSAMPDGVMATPTRRRRIPSSKHDALLEHAQKLGKDEFGNSRGRWCFTSSGLTICLTRAVEEMLEMPPTPMDYGLETLPAWINLVVQLAAGKPVSNVKVAALELQEKAQEYQVLEFAAQQAGKQPKEGNGAVNGVPTGSVGEPHSSMTRPSGNTLHKRNQEPPSPVPRSCPRGTPLRTRSQGPPPPAPRPLQSSSLHNRNQDLLAAMARVAVYEPTGKIPLVKQEVY
ncbi:hypothetical protein Agub_g11851 [Astrephomene gubernaculifera]|uniref:Uncharacterized protein n=1 Tax=Astrephomene gubernaculifera TaxID=47775 RepID=A0AAD3HR89_9CHLO|nr:hypothetical protein Agub_g11851 [Astrephomene gubernaculifera]